jgi:uncharacterized membrane protein
MSGNGLKIALGVSLVVNVFVVGAAAGVLLTHGHGPNGGRGGLGGNPLAHAGDALPTVDRDAFRATLRAQIPTVRPIQQDARQSRRAATDAIMAPTYDRAGIGALMARARADDEKARGQIEDAVLDFAAKLPADERTTLVEGMRRGAMQRWMQRRGGGQPPQESPPPQ